MGKQFIIPVALLLIISIFSGFYIGYWKGIAERQPIKLSCPSLPNITIPEQKCPNCICMQQQTECDIPQVVKVARDLANEKNYSSEYNCDAFSQELVRRYNNYGYDAYYCTGIAKWCMVNEKNSYDCQHAFVRLDSQYIEAMNGEFLSPEEFEKNYVLGKCIT
jgi:hypothetical protein